MTVLMFGWEFPPHISGGLGTACYGLTQALQSEQTKILFVVPKAHGDEPIKLINASDILLTDKIGEAETSTSVADTSGGMVTVEVRSAIIPYADPLHWQHPGAIEHWNYQIGVTETKVVTVPEGRRYLFSGMYGTSLMDEVKKYREVAATIAGRFSFDVIHAHDWLTYLAGIEAKKISGKPLVIHVHATEFDRAGEGNINQDVFAIEQLGMEQSDKIIAVSQWTKDIIVSKYGISADKVEVVYNGVTTTAVKHNEGITKIADRVVTFLGRITWQKGPQYFVEAAAKVLRYFPDTHFIMAGSGDLLPKMIELVAERRISDRFHFTGFMKGDQVDKVWRVSDAYVMPSVSEPFGITPLEAAQAGVPVIVSNQSGVAEVVDHAIKVDFWDTDALADAIMSVIRHDSLSSVLKKNGKKALQRLSWNDAARKLNNIYYELEQHVSAVH